MSNIIDIIPDTLTIDVGKMFRALFRIFFRSTRTKIHRKRGRRQQKPKSVASTNILGGKCHVIDGDTIIVRGTKIRLAGIDAPELEHPWGKKAKFTLIGLCKGRVVTAIIKDEISYDRIVAKCYLPDGTDIAGELVKQGLALDWRKFSGGEYRHLEPTDARKKLWRAAAKQQGRLRDFKS
ncbi:thermonuclease family protein [Pararhizobium sp. IMCC21322]|uniref:thermonuclease family protein n=1 Tax=Pararhizobium sp. IMCC21322 TaxID=3067903 RepID=UPI00274087F9|nr:thermonuclease family protein [Pararhizobium sp. IMCC21322]